MERERRLLTDALACHQSGNADAAADLYRQTLAHNPNCVDALHLLGLLLHERGDHDEAIRLIAKAIALQPYVGALHNSLGVVRLALDELELAVEAFRSAIGFTSTLAEAHRNLGLALRRMGRLAEAEDCYNEALRLQPSSAETQIDLGELAEQRGDWWTAESCFRQALTSTPSPQALSRATVALGRILNSQDRSQEARQMLEPLLATDAENPECRLQLGIALGKLGEHEKAAEHLRCAVDLNPDSATAHFNCSVSLLSLGNASESLIHAQLAHRGSGTDQSQRHLARVFKALGRFDEALELVEELRCRQPENPSLLEELAEIESQRGGAARAIELFQDALEIDPTRRRTLLRLAELCEAANQVDRTVETCVRILKRDPNSVGAHLLLGLVLSSRLRPEHRAKLDLDERDGLAERAFSHLQRAASIDPSAETFDAWGRALLHAGRHTEAIERLNQAVALNPSFAPSHENLGRSWLELGKMDSARGSFQKAVSIEPRSCDAHYELARLDSTESATDAIEGLHSLLSERDLSSHERMRLHFALARRLDSVGDHGAAFENYMLANGQKKTPHGDDADPSRSDATDRMIHLFDDAFFSAHAAGGSNSDLPVFIVGMPRSGTTLVEQILASHPNVHGAGELNDISDIANSLSRRLSEPQSYPDSAMQVDDPLAVTLADQYLTRLRQLIAGSSETHDADVQRVTDKMPTNFRHLGLIARLFPNARVVHLRRDPLDICVSCFKQNLAWPFCDLEAVGLYYRQYERLMEHWQRVLPLPIHEVHYERLVENQEDQSRRLVEFCGLPWSESCLEFADSQRAVQTPSKWQVRQPVYKTSIGAWRRYEQHLQPLIDVLNREG